MAHFNFVISQNAKWGHAGFNIDCHRMNDIIGTVPENILLQKSTGYRTDGNSVPTAALAVRHTTHRHSAGCRRCRVRVRALSPLVTHAPAGDPPRHERPTVVKRQPDGTRQRLF